MWYNLFDVINMYNMIGAYNGQKFLLLRMIKQYTVA